MSSPDDVLGFWFSPRVRPQWFVRSDAFDREICERFHEVYVDAAAGALDDWAKTPRGALALVILLDQFPRNMFRGTPAAFGSDAKAREIARAAVDAGLDDSLSQEERLFLYLPFEHSEDLADQERAVALIGALTENATWRDYAIRHRDIIARFGRFPHRNAILGRPSTAEEAEFLLEPNSSF
ncbi:MAG TPA: DUF924 family protein [Nannocystis sp.]